jgi:hypothetical protein
MKTPYQVVAELGLKPNLLGWKNSTSPVLAEFAAGAKTIVEVGSLLGASVAWMAKANPEAMFYCIDTWIDPGFPVAGPIQRDRFGAQMLYEQFLTNILAEGIENRVSPIRMTSTLGLKALAKAGILADMVYVDAGHDYSECYVDLVYCLPILAPGAVIVGDDCNDQFPGVYQACRLFADQEGFLLEVHDMKAILRRPA